jgi:hypothetical protein
MEQNQNFCSNEQKCTFEHFSKIEKPKQVSNYTNNVEKKCSAYRRSA